MTARHLPRWRDYVREFGIPDTVVDVCCCLRAKREGKVRLSSREGPAREKEGGSADRNVIRADRGGRVTKSGCLRQSSAGESSDSGFGAGAGASLDSDVGSGLGSGLGFCMDAGPGSAVPHSAEPYF